MTTNRLLQLLSRSVVALAFMFSLVGATSSFAQTIYVSSTTGSDAFDGATPTISGGSGPMATLGAAYAAAAAGNTISIEAGAYTESFDFLAAKGVVVVVRAAGLVTVATFTGTSTIAVGAANTITLNSGAGSIAVSGGGFTLTSGTISLGTGYLAFTAATALTVTGGTATGATPGYTGAVTAVYTFGAASSAGSEIPATLNAGGSLTVAGGFNSTFGNSLTAPAGIAVTNTALTTFSGAVTVNGAAGVVHTGNDASFVSIAVDNGIVSASGAAGQTLSVSGGVSATQTAAPANPFIANGAGSALTVTGAVTVTQSAGAILASGITNGTGTMSIGSLSVSGVIPGPAGDGGNDAHTFLVSNGGTFTNNGATSDSGQTDADETDTSVITITNTAGSSTYTGAFDVAGAMTANAAAASVTFSTTSAFGGAVTSAGLVTFGGNGSIAGVLNNTGAAAPNVFALGSNTLTLSGAAAHTALGKVTGATSTVSVTGNANVPAGNTDGNLSISGNGDVVAAVVVGGNLTMSGTNGDVNTAGSFDVAGNATFSGTHSIDTGAGTNDVDGSATFSGTVTLTNNGGGAELTIGSGSVSSTGSLTIPAGSNLTVNGSFNTSNGGAFAANPAANSVADNATLAFVLPQAANATYTPGPNTSVDDLTVTLAGGATAATLNLAQSVSVDENFTTGAGATVSLGNFLVRHTGNTAAAAIGGSVTTPGGQDGALAFEGTTTTLTGLGDISNILVNVGAGNRLSILGGTSVDFTGELTLFTGGITNAGDISPQGSLAEVRRNAAAGAATTDIIGAGTFNGDLRTYTLSIFGAGAITAASEYAATGITTLNIEDTANYTTNKVATVGNINTEVGATLTLGETFNVTATGVVSNVGTMDGTGGGANEVLLLTGDSQAHTNTGNMGPGGVGFTLSVQAAGTSVTGTATLAAAAQAASINNLIVGDGVGGTGAESVTMTNIQQINGTIAIATDGTASIGLVQDDAVGGTGNGDEGSVDGAVTVANGGSLTWTSDAIADAAVTVGTAPVGTAPTFDFNGNTVHVSTASAFAGVSNANFGSSGSLEFDAAGSVGTNLDGAAVPTSALPGLQLDAAATISSSTRVVGTTNVNASWGTGGAPLTLSGTVNLANTFTTTANVTIIGTTINVTTAHTIAGTLALNATSVDFVGLGAGADVLTVTGAYTHTAGSVRQTNVDVNPGGLFTQTAGSYALSGGDLNLGAGANFTAGAFSAAGSTDEVRWTGGGINTNGGTWSIPNVDVDVALVVDGAAGTAEDVLAISNRLEVSADLTAGNGSGAATPTGVINMGDNGGTFYFDGFGGNVVDAGADGTINHGTDTTTFEYNGTAVTAGELFDTFDRLIINLATTFAEAEVITVNNLDINAGGLDIENAVAANNSLTVTAGGSVNIGMAGPAFFGANAEGYIPADPADFTLTYDGTAVGTSTFTWASTSTPDLVITPVAPAGTVALHAARTANSINVAAGDVFDPATFNFTILGELQLNGSAVAIQSSAVAPPPAPGPGSVIFGGTTAQTLNGGLFYNGPVTVNNAAGLTLAGGNLNVSGNSTNTVCVGPFGSNPLTLTAGTITTGPNRVLLCHSNTTFQGFTRAAGSIFGNVQVVVDGTASPNVTDRVEFPTGDADGNYRPLAVTFNTPNQLGADPVMTTTYASSDPAGTNGLPISAVDELNNSFEIGRYAQEFHWEVAATPSVTPSIDYDVEYRAAGFANFTGEDIEKTRAIRRQDGSTDNFWIKAANGNSDNDNFAVSASEPVMVARNAVGAINPDGVLFAIGLENNFSSTNPAAITLNAGNTEVIDLTTIFSGGAPAGAAPSYTYSVVNGDAAVALGAAALDDLTLSGVAAGSSTVSVTATDSFGATSTATVTITVNSAFAAGTDLGNLAAVNAGAADATVDGAGSHTGGSSPVTFGVATSDAAVATAVVDGNGSITVTYVGVGTATITLTATDDEGDTVVDSFDVTVNAALGSSDALADVVIDEGATADTDVSGEFTGGTTAGDYAFTAASDNEDVATVEVAGATVTATGVSPYTVVAGAVTGDAAPATVTVTATDDLGAFLTSTYTVEVNPVAGDVDGSGGPSPAGASSILDHFLGLSTLTAKQQVAADFNGDASIDPFDAALVFAAFFNGKAEIVSNPTAELGFGEMTREETFISIPVQITGDLNDVVSASFSTRIDPANASIIGVTSDLGEGWMVRHVVGEDGTIRLALAGNGVLDADGTIVTINIELTSADVQFDLGAEGAVNDNATTSIDAVGVAELPDTFTLHGNYPNPFNPSTSINFDLPESADVQIQVIDMIGRQVMTLPATTIAAGANRTVQIDASRLASGPYFYRVIAKMESKTLVQTGRMMLVK